MPDHSVRSIDRSQCQELPVVSPLSPHTQCAHARVIRPLGGVGAEQEVEAGVQLGVPKVIQRVVHQLDQVLRHG